MSRHIGRLPPRWRKTEAPHFLVFHAGCCDASARRKQQSRETACERATDHVGIRPWANANTIMQKPKFSLAKELICVARHSSTGLFRVSGRIDISASNGLLHNVWLWNKHPSQISGPQRPPIIKNEHSIVAHISIIKSVVRNMLMSYYFRLKWQLYMTHNLNSFLILLWSLRLCGGERLAVTGSNSHISKDLLRPQLNGGNVGGLIGDLLLQFLKPGSN